MGYRRTRSRRSRLLAAQRECAAWVAAKDAGQPPPTISGKARGYRRQVLRMARQYLATGVEWDTLCVGYLDPGAWTAITREEEQELRRR